MRVHRVDEQDRAAGDRMVDHRRARLLGIFLVGRRISSSGVVEPRAGGAVGAAVQPDEAGEPLLHRLRQRVVGGAHIGEHRAALGRRHFERVQHREQRQHLLIGRVGVPVGGALDAVPVDLAVLVDIASATTLRDTPGGGS